MSDLAFRMRLTRQWFAQARVQVPEGSGWGWVPDVPPNPQDTAEVVCALTGAGLTVPERYEVERLLRTQVVRSVRGDAVFSEPIDLAWRIRALQDIGAAPDDPDVRSSVAALLAAQLPSGGWRMAGDTGPVSITATASAARALLTIGDDPAREGAGRAFTRVANRMTGADRQGGTGQTYEAAYAGDLLSHPHVAQVGGRLVARAQEAACDRLMGYLARRRYEVEEEPLARSGVIFNWRHLTLPLALRALARARPEALFDPVFRDALIALLALQDTTESSANRGGFRTSQEGFVTSYATTQSLEVLTAIKADLESHVSPAIAFDLLCHRRSAHHTDPQTVVKLGNRVMILNSTAGMAVMALNGAAAASLVVAALLLPAAQPGVSRAFLVAASLIAGVGISTYLITRLHRTPNIRIMLTSFTLFTALVLPVVLFLAV